MDSPVIYFHIVVVDGIYWLWLWTYGVNKLSLTLQESVLTKLCYIFCSSLYFIHKYRYEYIYDISVISWRSVLLVDETGVAG
jgi:hypothetical protein